MPSTHHGCLVIADIGGYTTYLSGVELEHSADILADLLQTVVDALRPTFALAKIEGDAVFVHDEGEADGSVVVDAVTGAYIAFMRRRRTLTTLTTCPCRACHGIPSLGLKLVAHRGRYATHEIDGRAELVGRDVIIVHRLLKNDIEARTSIRDYALYTDAVARELGLDPTALGLREDAEIYADIGTVRVHVDDLAARWAGEAEVPRHLIAEREGAAVVWEFAAPPPLIWEHLSHPERVVRFMADTATQTTRAGARGPGTLTHCVHGSQSYDLEVLDWIPYELQSLRFRTRGLTFLYNSIYEALPDGGTRLTARIAPVGPRGSRLLFPIVRRSIRSEYEGWMRSLEALLAEDAGAGPEEAPAPAGTGDSRRDWRLSPGG